MTLQHVQDVILVSNLSSTIRLSTEEYLQYRIRDLRHLYNEMYRFSLIITSNQIPIPTGILSL